MLIDKRLVLEYEDGQWTFRHINHTASYGQLLGLARGLNEFQEDPARRVLLVTVTAF